MSGSNRWLIIGGVAVILIGAGAWGWTTFTHKAADASEQNVPDEFALAKLRAESKEKPGDVFDKMRSTMDRDDLTEEQRRAIMENMRTVMEERMQERIDEYFNAPADQKEAILDKQIDEFEAMRKEREAREGEPKEPTEEEKKKMEERRQQFRGPQSREERKTRSETRDPNKSAQRMAYFSAMRSRMQARGIQPPRWGPGGGGRGPGGPGPRP